MLGALSILLALLIGFLLVRVLDPLRNVRVRWAATLFRAALGTGVGIGLTSVVFLILDVLGFATPAAIFGTDVALIAVLAWQWFRTRAVDHAPLSPDAPPQGFRWTWLLALAFAAALSVSYLRLVQMATALPVGDWDAWATWNLRAKFLAGPGDAWRYALSPLLSNTHPDYPLLLSGFVARAWKAGGTVDTIVPVFTALVFFAALLALLVSVVALLRGTASALLAGLVVLSTTSMLIWVPAQYSDVPLAFYFLGAIALIFLDASPLGGGPWALFWAGLCAAWAAWTKNEGLVFLASLTTVFCVVTLWRRRTKADLFRVGWLLLGAAPGVFLTAWLKFFLAPALDPLVTQGASGLARLSDLSRYLEVLKSFFGNVLNLGSGAAHPLVLLAILTILLRWQFEESYRSPSLMATTVLVLMFLSYCLVFLITPTALILMLQTTFDRMILQVWPSAILVFFVQLRRVVDPAPVAFAIKSGVVRKGAGRARKPVPAGHKVK